MSTRPKSIRPPPADPRPKNRLLARLPRQDFERLRPHLRTIAHKRNQIFHRLYEPIRGSSFQRRCPSVTTVMKNGTMVKNATASKASSAWMRSLEGTSDRQDDAAGSRYERGVHAGGDIQGGAGLAGAALRRRAARPQGFVTLMMHSTACMALHDVQERCCRWLLMTNDRVGRDDFVLSQEFLAVMLGSEPANGQRGLPAAFRERVSSHTGTAT